MPHYSIMPNHCHALLIPAPHLVHSLEDIMKRFKGRTGRFIRQTCGGTGPVWQREWFDRWIRNDAEYEKFAAYIRNNPVKAGLASHWQNHPWTK